MSKKERPYLDKVHTWGRIWTVGALLVLLSLPFGFCVFYNVWPEAKVVFSALTKVILIYWTTAIIEVITYTPMLGAGGTYLSFVTGNITNLKLPCGLNAMEKAGVKANSEEGEVISTIAIGSSAITTTIIIAVGVLVFSPVLPVLKESDTLRPAFSYVTSALFGALGASYFRKHWKISIFPIVVGVVVLLFAPTLGVGTLMFVTIVAAIVGALVMIKLNIVK
jgi:hypothetical protein